MLHFLTTRERKEKPFKLAHIFFAIIFLATEIPSWVHGEEKNDKINIECCCHAVNTVKHLVWTY